MQSSLLRFVQRREKEGVAGKVSRHTKIVSLTEERPQSSYSLMHSQKRPFNSESEHEGGQRKKQRRTGACYVIRNP